MTHRRRIIGWGKMSEGVGWRRERLLAARADTQVKGSTRLVIRQQSGGSIDWRRGVQMLAAGSSRTERLRLARNPKWRLLTKPDGKMWSRSGG